MATMLAFILTDAAVEKHALQHALRLATDTSFNRITIDGDRSTNDTVLCLANGVGGNKPLTNGSREWKKFAQTLEKMLFALSMKIVADAEGATRVVTVKVTGAATDGEADEAARAVANSLLNKTAWAGTRPNWGRVMDAIGYSYAQVQENKVDIDYDAVPAVRRGESAGTPEARLVSAVSKDAFTININLNLGPGNAVVYTCNCTEAYVRINEE
jgi:glutamate N-acetyltransferase/amino-acid N-acetyltransferase